MTAYPFTIGVKAADQYLLNTSLDDFKLHLTNTQPLGDAISKAYREVNFADWKKRRLDATRKLTNKFWKPHIEGLNFLVHLLA